MSEIIDNKRYHILKMSIKDLIEINPKVLGGTPVIKGTRIPVTLLKRLIRVGYPEGVITHEYPSLTIEKILAFKELIQSGKYVPETK